jgi:hypothetical protein
MAAMTAGIETDNYILKGNFHRGDVAIARYDIS